MRTTVNLDDDVAAAVDQLRREDGSGVSEAVNRLVRRGLTRREAAPPHTLRTYPMGLRVDVTNIGDVLELLDES